MKIAKTPADVDRIFAEALSAGDIDAALAMYAPDASYVDNDGSIARGHDEIRDVLLRLIALTPTLDCYEIDVVENGDTAVLRARWRFTGTDTTGAQFTAEGRSIEVARRNDDGNWQFIIDLPNGAS
jgi:uncharacterized protein (TIGR02246 family)